MQIKFRSTNFLHLQAGLFILVIGAAGIAASLFFSGVLQQLPVCFFRLWTGIPCPVCGATHAGLELSRGHLLGALWANPFFTFVYLAMIVTGINTLSGLVMKKKWYIELSEREAKWVRVLILAALPLNWIFLILQRFNLFSRN